MSRVWCFYTPENRNNEEGGNYIAHPDQVDANLELFWRNDDPGDKIFKLNFDSASAVTQCVEQRSFDPLNGMIVTHYLAQAADMICKLKELQNNPPVVCVEVIDDVPDHSAMGWEVVMG